MNEWNEMNLEICAIFYFDSIVWFCEVLNALILQLQ